MNTSSQTQRKGTPKPSFTPVRTGLLRRKCACGGTPGPDGECGECSKKHLQRRSTGQAEPSTVPPIVDDVLRSPGQPLDPDTRAFMEPRFGHDFSQVRVHTDTKAAESARAVDALAYTVGQDIVFRTGHYAPEARAGQQLLAHELTHALQQQDSGSIPELSRIPLGPRQDIYEREADARATALLDGNFTGQPPHTMRQPTLQRFAPFEFISDIFTEGPGEAVTRLFGEGEFPVQELQSYLDTLRKGKIEGRYDSDNKARATVRLWKTGNRAIQLTPLLKKLLIKEMHAGTQSKGDDEAILDLLERSENEDLRVIFAPGSKDAKSLYDEFGKSAKSRFQQFANQRVKGGLNALLKGDIEPVGAPSVAAYLNDQIFRERWEKGLDTALAQLKEKIKAGGCSFPRPGERRFDDVNWRPFQSAESRVKLGGVGFKPQSASPFDAVNLLFKNLDKWTCDCRLFPEIAMLGAWHEALMDRPEAFNNKFAGLVLRAEGPTETDSPELKIRTEGTTGLERDVIQTADDAQWKNAPVGTKVVWRNAYIDRDPRARKEFEYEHAIKTRKAPPGEEDLYAAHPFDFDKIQTEKQIKEALARTNKDYPWAFRLTASSLKELQSEGVEKEVVKSLQSILGKSLNRADFLDTPPLRALRKRVPQDPPRFSELITKILTHARQEADPKDAERYVAENISRNKIEIPK